MQALAATLSLGVLVAFMEYIQRLFVPVREFSQQIAVIQRALAALDHINELCGVPIDPAEREEYEAANAAASNGSTAGDSTPGAEGPEADEPIAAFESLVFEDVRFRYTLNGPEILKGISFRLTKESLDGMIHQRSGGGPAVLNMQVHVGMGMK